MLLFFKIIELFLVKFFLLNSVLITLLENMVYNQLFQSCWLSLDFVAQSVIIFKCSVLKMYLKIMCILNFWCHFICIYVHQIRVFDQIILMIISLTFQLLSHIENVPFFSVCLALLGLALCILKLCYSCIQVIYFYVLLNSLTFYHLKMILCISSTAFYLRVYFD